MGGLVVRTSLEPDLQAAAEKSLRDGLIAYDRRRGGWRGPVARIPSSNTEWLPALQAVARPGGTPPEWRLAVALEVQDRSARMAWLERPEPRSAPQPRTLALPIEEAAWARPVREGRLGAAPRRMQEVLSPGDVVLVEVVPGAPAQGRNPARPERLALRQLPEIEGAVVALDPNSGRVLAMAGGWSFERSWFNRATQAQRQPGSSFKPFVYLPAIEAGMTLNQQLLDAPVEIMTPQGLWRPGNYSGNPARLGHHAPGDGAVAEPGHHPGRPAGRHRRGGRERRARFASSRTCAAASRSLGAGETDGDPPGGGLRVLRQWRAAGDAPTLIDTVQDRQGRVIWRSDPRRCEGCEAEDPSAGPPELTAERRRSPTPSRPSRW
jgi:penicillin-binding protein 1A